MLSKKAIYGLKQAGRQWHERLSKKLKELNLEPTISDPCVYRGRKGSHILYMIIYVDDMLTTSTELDQKHQDGIISNV